MKKKGLIISTVVMVVVLLASIVTGTYAWFSASSKATVQKVSLNVGATSSVEIGVGKSASVPSQANYYIGTATYTSAGVWGGDSKGLGSTINLDNFTWTTTKAVGTGAAPTGEGESKVLPTTLDETFTTTNTYYAANAKKDSSNAWVYENISEASINAGADGTGTDPQTDIVLLEMGIRASQAGVRGTYAKMTISIPTTQAYIGIIASMQIEITVTHKTVNEAGTAVTATTTKNCVERVFAAGIDWDTDNDVNTTDASKGMTAAGTDANTYVVYFMIDDYSATDMKTGKNDITDFSIKWYLNGYDASCNDDAVANGLTNAEISFEFDGCDADWEAAGDAATKPKDGRWLTLNPVA